MVKVIQIPVRGFDDNFSYLVVGEGKHSKESVLIDATGDKEIINEFIVKNELKVVMQLLTHNHPDHCELVDYFEEKGIKLRKNKISPLGSVDKISVCGFEIDFISTPGHTKESVCIKIENNLFTGDTLFVRGVGTTAYGGSDEELEETLAFLSTLDSKLIVWPGHNYGGASAALGEALKNSHLKPTQKILDKIKERVEEYNKQMKKKF